MRMRLSCRQGKHDWLYLANGQMACFHCHVIKDGDRLGLNEAEAMSIGRDVKQMGRRAPKAKKWTLFHKSYDDAAAKKRKKK